MAHRADGRPGAAFVMRSAELRDALFTAPMLAELRDLLDLAPGVITDIGAPEARATLSTVEVLLTGWGVPALSDAQIDRMPRLRAVVHAGGAARHLLGSDRRRRRIAASNAGWANSVPVAEFALALVILSGKRALEVAAEYRDRQDRLDRWRHVHSQGNNGRVVGVVGASRVGRLLIDRLRPFSFRVLVHDPYLEDAEAAALGVEPVPLDALLRRSDVVSLHVPVLPETTGIIGSRELALLRDDAVLINTSRGAVVDQEALVAELRTGRLRACLDTTDPELLPRGHALYALPNVFLTPHIAGSTGNELPRLGETVIAEVRRFVEGRPFAHPEPEESTP